MTSLIVCTPQQQQNYVGDQIKKNEMSGAGGKCGGWEKCIQSLMEKAEGKRTLGGPRLLWED